MLKKYYKTAWASNACAENILLPFVCILPFSYDRELNTKIWLVNIENLLVDTGQNE